MPENGSKRGKMSEKQAVNGKDPDQGGNSLLSFSLFETIKRPLK